MKSFPNKGDNILVIFLTDFLIPQTFSGICVSSHWAGKNTTITVINSVGIKQKFFFFSPLVSGIVVKASKKKFI